MEGLNVVSLGLIVIKVVADCGSIDILYGVCFVQGIDWGDPWQLSYANVTSELCVTILRLHPTMYRLEANPRIVQIA